MNKQKIIHIGYPLTITTFLNKFLLDVFNDDFHIHDDLIIENIVNQDINFCDYSGLVKKKIQNKNFVFSNSGLLGNIYHGGLNFYSNCIKINKIFGDEAKIIIGLKNQKDLIIEVYKYYVFCGGTKNIYEWLNNEKILNQTNNSNFNINVFNYHELIKLYLTFFKKNNVKIILCEQFEENNEFVIKDLCIFLNIDFKKDYLKIDNNHDNINTKLIIEVLRKINHFCLGVGRHDAIFNTQALTLRVYLRLIDRYLTNFNFNKFSFKNDNLKILNKSNTKLFKDYGLDNKFYNFYNF